MVSSPHTAFQSLPVVDVSGLYADDAGVRRQVADELGKAAREVGFLYVTGHRVEAALTDALIRLTRDYFAQPAGEKMRHYIGRSSNHSGYVPVGEEQFADAPPDTKEAYDISFDYLPEAGRRPMLGPNQWPDFPGFTDTVKRYYEAVFELSNRLFSGFALALGLPEDRFESLVSTPPSQLRLIHYPWTPKATGDQPGIGAHTDYECFTILLPTAPGLEVLNGAGEWIDAPVVPGAFVINIGDMLEVMSNGRFVATSHRVRKVAEERYSFPLFCSCDYDTVVEPLPEFLSPGETSRYTPIRCGDHLYAQTMQTFHYLKSQLDAGTLALPEGARHLSSFGYGAVETEAAR